MRGQDGTDTSSRCERAPAADVLPPLAGVAPPLPASAPGLSCLGGGAVTTPPDPTRAPLTSASLAKQQVSISIYLGGASTHVGQLA